MTSPVDTSVKYFTSAMPGAPVLNGVVGSLISLLDACLVDGFGAKSASSLVVAGGIATLTFAGGASAAVTDSVILVAGATPSSLNGEQKVLSAGATSVTFATSAADTTATGTITFKLAPANWSKAFSGTNLAAYKSTSPESTGCYLRVDDTGTTIARVVGYESMSAIGTGTGPFPTSVQMSGGGYWGKSTIANSTANNWTLVADDRFFLLFIAPLSGANAQAIQGTTRCFGDHIPLRLSGDAYACGLSYSTNPTVTSTYDNSVDYSTGSLHAMPRAYTGLGSAVLHTISPYTGGPSALSGVDSTLGAFPSVIDGGLRLSKKFVASATSAPPRCDVPGFYHVPQVQALDSFKWNDKIDGTGSLTGKRLIAVNGTQQSYSSAATSSQSGVSFIDITGPWR